MLLNEYLCPLLGRSRAQTCTQTSSVRNTRYRSNASWLPQEDDSARMVADILGRCRVDGRNLNPPRCGERRLAPRCGEVGHDALGNCGGVAGLSGGTFHACRLFAVLHVAALDQDRRILGEIQAG